MRVSLSILFLVLALAGFHGARGVDAQELTPVQVNERMMERRAIQAVIWGMPAVNTQLMLQEMLAKTQGRVNQVLYWSRPADASNQTLTPNPDSIYFMTFFDTKKGPVVLEVPPADTGSFAGNIVNAWQMPLEDAGPEGADKGKGGKYLLLPPDFSGKAPPGYIVLRVDTFTGYALFRSNLVSHNDSDVAKAVAYGKRLKVYPLSQAGHRVVTQFADANGIEFDSTIRYDLSFFQFLDRVVQYEPWLPRDRVMIDQLKSIGIEKGKPYRPGARSQEILKRAIQEAQVWLDQQFESNFPPYWPGSHWGLPASPEMINAYQTSYADPHSYPVDARAIIYTYTSIGIKRLGRAQFYLMTIKDKDGQSLDGSMTYRLTVPPNVPVNQYWSATAYDRARHTLLNTLRPSRSSQISDLQKNADGSIDIYFGPQEPEGKETNWVPTVAGRQFEVMFRLYGPQQSLFEKTWRLPDVQKIR